MPIQWNLSASEIERESFRIIEEEVKNTPLAMLEEPAWRIARRLIHTTADLHIADTLTFSNNPIDAGIDALLQARPIFCDSKMIRSGLSLQKLQAVNTQYSESHILCSISDADVIERAKKENRTRAICAVEKNKEKLGGAIILIGNAPLALARICQYVLEEQIKPALIIGMPVGFVNVVESKELLTACSVPYISLLGRRGGSALAVTTLHAIMENILEK